MADIRTTIHHIIIIIIIMLPDDTNIIPVAVADIDTVHASDMRRGVE